MPPYNVKVLICTKDGEVVVGELRLQWHTDQLVRGSKDIVAWMPFDAVGKPIVTPKPKKKFVDYLKIIK